MESVKPIDSSVERIAKECREATASEWDVTKIVKELNNSNVRDIEKMRGLAIETLETLNPKAATIYASFHRLKVFTSAQKIEPFDRGNIIKSLVKETTVSRSVAEKIGSEVEDSIKDLKISNLTTALIREMVNVKLLEYGYESVRNEYARLGLPVYEVRDKISNSFYDNDEILEEYNLTNVIPHEIAEQHFASDIFISDIAGFSTRNYCVDLSSETDFLSLLGKVISFSDFFKILPSVSACNFSFEKNNENDLLRFINMYHSLAEKKNSKPHLGVSLFVPEKLESEIKNSDSGYETANKIMQLRDNGKGTGINFTISVSIDSKYKLKLISKLPADGCLFLNCKNNELHSVSETSFSSFEIVGFKSALNLSKIAFKNKRTERIFFKELESVVSSVKKLSEVKETEMSKRTYLKQDDFSELKQGNVLEMSDVFSVSELFGIDNLKENVKFSEKIVRTIKELLPHWDLQELSDSHAVKRFADENSEFYSNETSVDSQDAFLKSNSFMKENYFKICRAENKKQIEKLIDERVLGIRV
ncbi:MAG: ATP cone domain-containing protein [Candidatus Diapherotrites archaeon]